MNTVLWLCSHLLPKILPSMLYYFLKEFVTSPLLTKEERLLTFFLIHIYLRQHG